MGDASHKLQVRLIGGRSTVYVGARRFVFESPATTAADAATLIAAMPVRTAAQDRRFLFSADLGSEAFTNALGGVFRGLIGPRYHFHVLTFLAVINCLILLEVLGVTRFVGGLGVHTLYRLASPAPLEPLWTTLVTLALLVWHELGHVAAIRRFGLRADGFGAGVYLFLPALYTRLSLVNLLSRRDRIVVYSAGVHFQMIATVPLAAIATTTSLKWLEPAIVSNLLIVALNMVPLLRFDGYKIVRELTEGRNVFFARAAKVMSLILTTLFVVFFVTFAGHRLAALGEAMSGGQRPGAGLAIAAFISTVGLVFLGLGGISWLRSRLA